jgi:hypothetical protein
METPVPSNLASDGEVLKVLLQEVVAERLAAEARSKEVLAIMHEQKDAYQASVATIVEKHFSKISQMFAQQMQEAVAEHLAANGASISPEDSKVQSDTQLVVRKGEEKVSKDEVKKSDVYSKDDPAYFCTLTKAIFVVGLNKCITPASLLLMSLVFLGIDLSTEVQHIFEQIAGGLLVYTWGVKCMAPIQDAFQAAAAETRVANRTAALIGLAITVFFVFASLFYIATSGDEIDGSIFMHGVMEDEDTQQCSESGQALSTAAPSSISCTSFGSLRARPARAHLASASCSSQDDISLLPYFLGFALDAIMLILVDPEEELIQQFVKIKTNYIGCLVDLLLAPIAFSLDNFLAGAGVCTLVVAKAGSKGGAVFIFLLFALSCAIGVPIAFAMRGFQELLIRQGCMIGALWWKFTFLLCIALSFLDNGLSLCSDGLTFWVGLGGCCGWLLYMMELLMDNGKPKN